MSKILVKELEEQKLEEFRTLVRKIFDNYDSTYVLKALGHVRTYVALHEGKIVGFVETYMRKIGNKKVGVLYYIGVHPKYRRRGVGKTLVTQAIDYFRKHGVQVIMATTRSWNVEARKFFRKLGFKEYSFEEIARKKGYSYFLELVKALYAYEDDIFLIKEL